MAEIRIFHHNRFLWRAICADLAGETIALREIMQARDRRRVTQVVLSIAGETTPRSDLVSQRFPPRTRRMSLGRWR